MPLNASGAISLGGATAGESINLELGLSATAQVSLNDTVVRTLLQVPSGQISMSSAYSKSNAVGSYNLSVVTSSTVALYMAGGGVDSSSNFWVAQDNGQVSRSINLTKYNSNNALVSTATFATTGAGTYLSTGMNIGYGQRIAFDGSSNMYVAGSSYGTRGSTNIGSVSIAKFNSSGSYVAGKGSYRFSGGTYAAEYLLPSYVYYNSTTNYLYCFPDWYWLQQNGTDELGNPLYTSGNDTYIHTFNSSTLVETRFQWMPSISIASSSYRPGGWGAVYSNGDQLFGYSTSSSIGNVTAIGRMQAGGSFFSWFKRYKILYGGTNIVYDNTQDGSGPLIGSDGSAYIPDLDTGIANWARMMKVDSSGNFQWSNNYYLTDYAYQGNFYHTAKDSSDNIYLVGTVNETYGNAMRIAIIKINSSGVVQWARLWASLTTPWLNGTGATGQNQRRLDNPTVEVDGSYLRIWFSAYVPSGSTAMVSVKYPLDGAFTGTTNVYYPGSGTNYYSFQIINAGVTSQAHSLNSSANEDATNQTNGTYNETMNASVTTHTVSTTLQTF